MNRVHLELRDSRLEQAVGYVRTPEYTVAVIHKVVPGLEAG